MNETRQIAAAVTAALAMIAPFVCAQSPAPAYSLELMALTGYPTGSQYLTTIDPYVGINDQGICAFTGRDGGSISRAWTLRVPGAQPLQVTFGSATRDFLGASINNSFPFPQVATRDRLVGATSNSWLVRRWLADGSQAFVTVGRSTVFQGFNPTFSQADEFVDINDSTQGATYVSFGGVRTPPNDTQSALYAGTYANPQTSLPPPPPSCLSYLPPPAVPTQVIHSMAAIDLIRPQVSNDDRIVYRTRDSNSNNCVTNSNGNHCITTIPAAGGTPQVHAGPATVPSFSSLGSMPGISHDGQVVAWVGDRGNGQGIFVSIPLIAGVYATERIAGEGLDAFSTTGFPLHERVAVLTTGTPNPSILMTVVFQGTIGGVRGIYAVDAHIRAGLPSQVDRGQPKLVAQVGTMVTIGSGPGSVARTIASMTLYDPLNRCGQVAFGAAFTDGSQGVIRATRTIPSLKKVRISAKRVLDPAGVPAANWICDIAAVVNQASAMWKATANVEFCLEEIVDVSGQVVGGLNLFDVNYADIDLIEAAAENNPGPFAWRTHAINVYFCNTVNYPSASPNGLCSFPMPTNPCGGSNTHNDIIFMVQGPCNGSPLPAQNAAETLAHELGHYFNLLHTHTTCAGTEQPPCYWLNIGGIHAPNACISGDFVDDTPSDPDSFATILSWYGILSPEYDTLTTNLMSYYFCGRTSLTRGQSVRAHQAIELFRGSVVVPPGFATVNIAGPGCPCYPNSTLGWSGDPKLAVTRPQIGQYLTFGISRAPVSRPGILWVSLPVPPSSYIPLGGGCTAYLDIPSLFLLSFLTTDTSGNWSWTVPLPSDPSLVGGSFVLQADIEGGGGYGIFDITNGVVATLGY